LAVEENTPRHKGTKEEDLTTKGTKDTKGECESGKCLRKAKSV